MKKPKFIADHKDFQRLAKMSDDLKFILITYGNSLGSTLKSVQKEFHKYDRRCTKLAEKLGNEGWLD